MKSTAHLRPAQLRFASRPAVEGLETRLALSSAASLHAAAVVGSISGVVTDATHQVGLRHLQVQLFSSSGRLVARTLTSASGAYQFNVTKAEPYVVHVVAPHRLTQVTPTFANAEPTGSYINGAGSNSWNYGTNTNPAAGPVGPSAWSSIAPAAADPFESPINITTQATDLSRYLTVEYASSTPKQIVNNSHQIQVQLAPSATDQILVGGTEYRLSQFHYHGPAENTVHGRSYLAEEHFVNTSASGGETVVAVFLKLGAHNTSLDPILNAAATSLTKPNTATKTTSSINFAGLLPVSTQGWFFTGSLTTPPASLPVNWFVYQQPITLDLHQAEEYTAIASGSGFFPNNRPVQPTNGRRLNEIDSDVVVVAGQALSNVNFSFIARA